MKFLLIMILFALPVFAQKAIHWRPEKCSTVEIPQTETQCDEYVQNDDNVHTIKYKDVLVAVVLFYTGEHFAADVFVQNNSKDRVLVDREAIKLGIFKTEELSDQGELLSSIPPENIAQKIQNRIAWANALGAIGAGMKTNTSQSDVLITDNRGNTASGTVTTSSPDTSAQRQEAERGRQRSAQANNQSVTILQGALKSNTLFENQTTNGIVYFKRNRQAKVGILTIPISGVNFYFPIRYSIK